jgi:hypothetical protein
MTRKHTAADRYSTVSFFSHVKSTPVEDPLKSRGITFNALATGSFSNIIT